LFQHNTGFPLSVPPAAMTGSEFMCCAFFLGGTRCNACAKL
jgi:hypothetical protein